MTARVSQFPSQYPAGMMHNGMNGMPGVNTDPGVYEPECDWGAEPPEPTGYPDTQVQ